MKLERRFAFLSRLGFIRWDSDTTYAKTIQEAAETAASEYIAWQKEKLGRDLNPTELYYRLRKAGVKRVDLG